MTDRYGILIDKIMNGDFPIAELVEPKECDELLKHANKGALLSEHYQEMNTLIRQLLLSIRVVSQTDAVLSKVERLGEIMRLMKEQPTLKPCPFCGGEGVIVEADRLHTVSCDNCNVKNGPYTNDQNLLCFEARSCGKVHYMGD